MFSLFDRTAMDEAQKAFESIVARVTILHNDFSRAVVEGKSVSPRTIEWQSSYRVKLKLEMASTETMGVAGLHLNARLVTLPRQNTPNTIEYLRKMLETWLGNEKHLRPLFYDTGGDPEKTAISYSVDWDFTHAPPLWPLVP